MSSSQVHDLTSDLAQELLNAFHHVASDAEDDDQARVLRSNGLTSLGETPGRGTRDELAGLLDARDNLVQVIQANEAYIHALGRAYRQTKTAKEEMKRLEEYVKHVNRYQENGEAGAALPSHSETVRLPFYGGLTQAVPLLKRQADEVEDLRLIATGVLWRAEEREKLGRIVLNHCKRAITFRARSQMPIDDLDAFLSTVSEEDLAKVSLPDVETGADVLDWNSIADDLGTTHSAEDCRTQWLMKDRPSLRQGDFEEAELAHLQEVISKHSVDGGMVKDWNAIADELANGRTALDCFAASQLHDLSPLYAATKPHRWSRVAFSSREADEFDRLHRIWGNRAVIIEERLGTSRPKKFINSRVAATHSAVRWSGRADNALIRYVSTAVRMRRSNLLCEPERASNVDWKASYVGRPKRASEDQVRERWRYIAQDFTRHREKYLQDTGGES